MEVTATATQKFPAGSRVRISNDLGFCYFHFPSGRYATVKHTYAEAYGGSDVKSYCLDVDGVGETAWYRESQLELVALPTVTWPTPISVKERLPETPDDVLVRVAYPSGYTCWQISCFEDDDWWVDSEYGGNSVVRVVKEAVTHGLPLPPAP